jgi:hypothetical protein
MLGVVVHIHISITWEEEEGGRIGSLRPVWNTWQDPASKWKKREKRSRDRVSLDFPGWFRIPVLK